MPHHKKAGGLRALLLFTVKPEKARLLIPKLPHAKALTVRQKDDKCRVHLFLIGRLLHCFELIANGVVLYSQWRTHSLFPFLLPAPACADRWRFLCSPSPQV